MKTFEFKSQICTTKEQSEKLLALGLKRETADMMYVSTEATCMGRPIPEEDRHYEPILSPYAPPFGRYAIHIPAWSLGRLLELCGGIAYDWLFRSDNYFENMVSCIEWMVSKECCNKDYLEE